MLFPGWGDVDSKRMWGSFFSSSDGTARLCLRFYPEDMEGWNNSVSFISVRGLWSYMWRWKLGLSGLGWKRQIVLSQLGLPSETVLKTKMWSVEPSCFNHFRRQIVGTQLRPLITNLSFPSLHRSLGYWHFSKSLAVEFVLVFFDCLT